MSPLVTLFGLYSRGGVVDLLPRVRWILLDPCVSFFGQWRFVEEFVVLGSESCFLGHLL